jgi:hypothetical protein
LKNKKKNSNFCSVLFLQSLAFSYFLFRIFIPSHYQNPQDFYADKTKFKAVAQAIMVQASAKV